MCDYFYITTAGYAIYNTQQYFFFSSYTNYILIEILYILYYNNLELSFKSKKWEYI
jgi:hypothetical protein